MTEKTKKRLTIAGVSVLGLALLVAIGMQFAKAPDKPDSGYSADDTVPQFFDHIAANHYTAFATAHLPQRRYMLLVCFI